MDSLLIRENFDTLKEFELFHLAWTRVCAKLNPTEINVERLEISEHRAKVLKLEA